MSIKDYPSPLKHIISSYQFTKEYINELFALTDKIIKNPEKYKNELRGKIVAALFYEPSTRTRFSFESATYKLGGNVISTENAKQFSSAAKGESLQDSIKVISTYADFIILRHYDDESSDIAYKVSSVSVINAGSGKKEHPTQALLDAYTIYSEKGSLDNLSIALVGDLLRGRTIDSLVYLLSKYDNNTFYFVSPPNSKIKNSLMEFLQKNKIKFYESEFLEEVIEKVDVLYMTRIQKERFDSKKEYEIAKGKTILDEGILESLKKDAIIMHPLPRVDEIPESIDKDSRAKYFKQAENGLWVRMAILKILNDYKKLL